MIRIIRSLPAPAALSALISEDRFSHETVRNALRRMQREKCCYCEIYITDWGPGRQVDHYRPKDKYRCLKYDWDNLLVACGECNHAKSNKFPKSLSKDPLILNPYDPCDDPEDHVDYLLRERKEIPIELEGSIIPKDDSPKGKKTIGILRLNKLHQVKRRRETLGKLVFAYLLLLTQVDLLNSGTGSVEELERCKHEIRDMQSKDKTYLGLVRAFFRKFRVEEFGVN